MPRDTLPTYGRSLCRAYTSALIQPDALARLRHICPVCDDRWLSDSSDCPRCTVSRLPQPSGTVCERVRAYDQHTKSDAV